MQSRKQHPLTVSLQAPGVCLSVNSFPSISSFSLLVIPPFPFFLVNPPSSSSSILLLVVTLDHTYTIASQDQCWALKIPLCILNSLKEDRKSLSAACSSLSLPASMAAHLASHCWRWFRTAHWKELHQAAVPSFAAFLPRTCAASLA